MIFHSSFSGPPPPGASWSPFSSTKRPGFPWKLWSGYLSLSQMPSCLPSAYLQSTNSPLQAQGWVLGPPLTPHVPLRCPAFLIHLLSWLSSSHGLCSYQPSPSHVPSHTACYQFQASECHRALEHAVPTLENTHTNIFCLPLLPQILSQILASLRD